MRKTQKLLNDWSGVEFQSSTGKTEQFKSFARAFKAAIKEQTADAFDLISCKANHFDISGFLKSKEDPSRFVYFSISDVRGFREEWANQVLIRTAQHEKDYSGGHNNYTDLASFGENAKALV